ncbi:hypothetical protein I302_100979 [Kwoniella bestiolae CBS 10118]|uniref:Uncharacterized protein n=1 Tax=Kwoniella bestiolae CBS 10118 TaxID=1296100 RepID=A0A1B9G6K8_9TREE|nr:hypothetical protein I302_04356 [Kwoniella bestiolae CBS 10118]OCF26669.1 hypothetical protein I302_04356 [Kwoniella bestiolae CBS 10118]
MKHSPSTSVTSVPSSDQGMPTGTVAGQWTVSHKNRDETYVTNTLPSTVERRSVYKYEEDAVGGKRVIYGIGAFDKATGNDYCWEGDENQWKEALSSGGGDNTTSSNATEMLKRAATDLNINGDKLISEKREFATDKGENVTWWTECSADGPEQDTRYCYVKRRDVKIEGEDVEKVLYKNFSLSELEHEAERNAIASEIFSRMQGFEASRSDGSHDTATMRGNATTSKTCSDADGRIAGTKYNSKQSNKSVGESQRNPRIWSDTILKAYELLKRGDPTGRNRLCGHQTQTTSCSSESNADRSRCTDGPTSRHTRGATQITV